MHNNQKKWGLLTGYSVVLMALVAGFVYGFVHSTIYKAGDSDLTARLLQENIAMYKWGIVSWILIFVLDIIVSLGLYIIYKAEQKKLAILSSVLRVLYTLILGIAVAQLIIPLINKSEIAKSLLYFESFEKIFSNIFEFESTAGMKTLLLLKELPTNKKTFLKRSLANVS